MAYQPESATWRVGVYQVETTDPVEGGVGGITNKPLLDLADRTAYLKAMADLMWLPGDVKEIDCNNAYMTANFDGTGLGTGERLGWAICNGNNGTQNRTGRVSVGHGSGYATLGSTGGSRDAVLVSHKHSSIVFDSGLKAVNDTGTGASVTGHVELSSSVGDGKVDETSTEGESGLNKNMQPYIVTLFIQKL